MGYVLHFTGVTSSGVPFLELIQPVAVRRHGHWSVYGAPRPSVTCNAMSSSSGALSIGFQPKSRDGRITGAPRDVAPLQRGLLGFLALIGPKTRPAAGARSGAMPKPSLQGQPKIVTPSPREGYAARRHHHIHREGQGGSTGRARTLCEFV